MNQNTGILFELTKEISDSIAFVMENQNAESVIDLTSGVLHEKGSVQNDDMHRYSALPPWTSADGFRLMSDFVAHLQNPAAHDVLSAVLDERHGVFRRFKDAVDTLPDIKPLWLSFKDTEMRRIVRTWYNVLCEARGLETIGEEPEDTADIIASDFVFCWTDSAEGNPSCSYAPQPQLMPFAQSADNQSQQNQYRKDVSFADECCTRFWKELSTSLSELTFTVMRSTCGNIPGYSSVSDCSVLPSFLSVYTQGGIRAGILSLYLINGCSFFTCYIVPEFRGLGLAGALIDRLMERCAQLSVHQTGLIAPIMNGFAAYLERRGFVRTGPLFVCNSNK